MCNKTSLRAAPPPQAHINLTFQPSSSLLPLQDVSGHVEQAFGEAQRGITVLLDLGAEPCPRVTSAVRTLKGAYWAGWGGEGWTACPMPLKSMTAPICTAALAIILAMQKPVCTPRGRIACAPQPVHPPKHKVLNLFYFAFLVENDD